ncbi:hypothetical protein PSQ19_05960 [Devosia algicola]|uniref:DUF2628 domain-containing protein n=1 Tax=Devosia algicola TaxID=3026418 RepID=A0ABY7YQY7_9HYPH|nr:hypothetical protein [Devosia algicola]WDR03612.1 hypothetical protein PSQ19_05960 [Devosia algicola]
MDWLISIAMGFVPWWVWIIIAGATIGAAFKYLGWQGVLGAAIAVLTLGAYREGWRSRDRYKPPSDDKLIGPYTPPPTRKRNVWSAWDILRGRND